jgi:hypothetical protein
MRLLSLAFFLALFSVAPLHAKIVVFSEPGFPVVDSQPVSVSTLTEALGPDTVFASIAALQQGDALRGADLLVLPYGSAVPVEAWASVEDYLHGGGNLLVIGGQPLHVPVSGHAGAFTQGGSPGHLQPSAGFPAHLCGSCSRIRRELLLA